MKYYSKIMTCIAFMVAAFSSCSELVDVRVKDMDCTFLVVESFLTDCGDFPQTVTLSESVHYYAQELAPAVGGASVTVDDGSRTVRYFENDTVPGLYVAPEGFCGTPGGTYHLHIDAVVGGEQQSYDAVSTMPEPGFQLDSIDYAFAGNELLQIDSIWTVSIWGSDLPQTSWFYIGGALNGNVFPYALSMAMDDKYFAGQSVEGFPITMLMQFEYAQQLYGPCCKYLETGDVLTVYALTLDKDCYDFFISFAENASGVTIPMFSSQPASCPTNITGGPAMGWFAACPLIWSDRVVDDPKRTGPKGSELHL